MWYTVLMKHKNTVKKGQVRYVVFKDADEWYAAALELNIVENGSTPQEAMVLLFDAIQGYVETARKMHIRPYVLNQKVDSEYEQLWVESQHKTRPMANEVFSVGQLALA